MKQFLQIAEKNLQFIYSKYEKAISIILVCIVAAISVLYLVSAFYRGVNADAAYYLGSTEMIFDGMLPFRDFCIGYTPLVFYLLLPFRALMGAHPDASIYNFICSIFLISVSFIVYKIAKQISKNTNFSLLLYLLVMILMLTKEGASFILEPFVLFFGLLSIWFLINSGKSWIFTLCAGLSAGAAFMSKQYGLAFIAVNVFYLFLNRQTFKEFVNKTLLITAGFMILPVIFAVGFMLSDVSFSQIFEQLFGNDYGQRNDVVYFYGLAQLLDIFIVQAFVLLSLFYLFAKRKQDSVLYFSLIFGVALLTLQFFFATYPHYFILIIPLIIIVLAIVFISVKYCVKFILVICVLLSICNSGKYITERLLASISENSQKQQIAMAQTISSHIKDEKSIYCLGTSAQKFYILLDKKPVMFEKYGYSFGELSDTEIKILERIEATEYLIVWSGFFIPEYRKKMGKDAIATYTEYIIDKIQNTFDKIYEDKDAQVAFYIRKQEK
jgi:hypothetical protein